MGTLVGKGAKKPKTADEKKIAELKAKNKELEKENKVLKAEVETLKAQGQQ